LFFSSWLLAVAFDHCHSFFLLKTPIMNMYVSNLGFQVSDLDLRKLFEQFGTVSSAKVITDRETGRSRGFGFVEMDSDTEAKEAMAKLNNQEVEGRALSVTTAREKTPRNNGWK
jgi:RNA recognition motif-containing protein